MVLLVGVVPKTHHVDFTTQKGRRIKYSYADLADCNSEISKHLETTGLSISQFPVNTENRCGIETILMHSSGQWISNVIHSQADFTDPQSMGTVFTYLRRYSLSCLGIVTDLDTDGDVPPNNKSRPQNATSQHPKLKLIDGIGKKENRK